MDQTSNLHAPTQLAAHAALMSSLRKNLAREWGGEKGRGGDASGSTPVPPATPVTTTGALESHGTNHQVGENRGSNPSEGRATHYPCSLARARTNSSEWTPCRMADAMGQEIPPMV